MDPELLPIQRDEDTDAPAGRLAGCVTIRIGAPGQSVVVLDHALVQRLDATLKALAKMRGVTGLVLASTSDRVFIAGADLKAINGLTDDQLDRYIEYGQRVFGIICDLPYPTAAAINGAALGGGLELAMHCDALIGAPSASSKPYPIGLPEAGLCLCPGWGGTNLFPARIDPADAIQRTATGKPLTFDEAVASRMFDAVAASPAELVKTAKEWIAQARSGGGVGRRDGSPRTWSGRLGRSPVVTAALFRVDETLPRTPAAEAVLAAVRAGLENGWRSALDCERRHLVRLRSTPEAKAALRAFFERAAAPKK